MAYEAELEIALELAREAGAGIRWFHGKNSFLGEKNDFNHRSPLSAADLFAHECIVSGLRAKFPYPVLSEESFQGKKHHPTATEHLWIVDPLDGTKNFLHGGKDFTVNIALARRGVPVLGVVYAPALNEMYHAVLGQGAFLEKGTVLEEDKTGQKNERGVNKKGVNEKKYRSGSRSTLRVSCRKALAEMHAAINRHDSEECPALAENFKSLIVRSSSLKGCLVASGAADAYLRIEPCSEWDICAMHCIVREAGGVMKFLDGTEITYNRPNVRNKPFLAASLAAFEPIRQLALQVMAQGRS